MTHDFNWHVKWSVTLQKWPGNPKNLLAENFTNFKYLIMRSYKYWWNLFLIHEKLTNAMCLLWITWTLVRWFVCLNDTKKCCIFPSKHQVENRNWPDVPMSVLKILAKFMPIMFDCCSKTGMLTCRLKSWRLRSLVKALRNFALITALANLARRITHWNGCMKWNAVRFK